MADPHQVEALAQLLYEAANPTAVPWSQRHLVIRESWLNEARRRLAAIQPLADDGTQGEDEPAGSVAGTRAVLDAFRRHGMGANPLSMNTLEHETRLEPATLVHTVSRLVDRGLLGQLAMPTSRNDHPVFRLLDPGKALLVGGGIDLRPERK